MQLDTQDGERYGHERWIYRVGKNHAAMYTIAVCCRFFFDGWTYFMTLLMSFRTLRMHSLEGLLRRREGIQLNLTFRKSSIIGGGGTT